jgi:hypothetical protein
VLGRSFDPDAVRDASGRSEEEVVAALEELLARGVLVEVDGDGALDFRHEQERNAEALGHYREAALRNRHADLLHAAGRREEAMAELKAAVAIFADVGEEGRLDPEIWKLSEW